MYTKPDDHHPLHSGSQITYQIMLCCNCGDVCLLLQFWHMVLSASTDTTSFAQTVKSTATKRAGYVYITTLSGFTNLTSAALWSSEGSLVGNATVC